jgi:Zn-dependent protease
MVTGGDVMDRPVVIPGATTLPFRVGGFPLATARGGGRLAALLAVFMFIVAGDPLRALLEMATHTSLPAVPAVTAATLLLAVSVFVFASSRFGSVGAMAVVVAGVYTWVLRRPPDLSDTRAAFAAAAFAGLFIGGTLLHELGHAWAGRRMGLRVRGLALTPWGAACAFVEDETKEMPSPLAMVTTTAAGPLGSLAAAGICFGATALVPSHALADMVLFNVAVLNLALAVANLLPLLPIDGGWVLAGILWHRHRDWSCEEAVLAARPVGRRLLNVITVVTTIAAGASLLLNWTAAPVVVVSAANLILLPLVNRLAMPQIDAINQALQAQRACEELAALRPVVSSDASTGHGGLS